MPGDLPHGHQDTSASPLPEALATRGREHADPAASPTGAPHLVGVDPARLSREVTIALALCLLAVAATRWLHGEVAGAGIGRALAVFAVALAAGLVWTRVFAEARGRARSVGVVATALLFALLLPFGVPLWQVALGASFAVVFGQEVFGGSGHGFVHPVVVGLVFLQFAYPGRLPGGQLPTPTIAVALATGWLLARRAVRWRVILAAAAGYLVAAAAAGWRGGEWLQEPSLGTFAFAVVFLAADPVTAAVTTAGRWFQGALVGALVVLLRVASPDGGEGVAVAILFGNVCAPSVDVAVARLRAARVETRHG